MSPHAWRRSLARYFSCQAKPRRQAMLVAVRRQLWGISPLVAPGAPVFRGDTPFSLACYCHLPWRSNASVVGAPPGARRKATSTTLICTPHCAARIASWHFQTNLIAAKRSLLDRKFCPWAGLVGGSGRLSAPPRRRHGPREGRRVPPPGGPARCPPPGGLGSGEHAVCPPLQRAGLDFCRPRS